MAKPRTTSTIKVLGITAWTGVCFGLASTSLIIAFSKNLLNNLFWFSMTYVVLAAVLLVGGLLGFNLSRKMVRKKTATRHSRSRR